MKSAIFCELSSICAHENILLKKHMYEKIYYAKIFRVHKHRPNWRREFIANVIIFGQWEIDTNAQVYQCLSYLEAISNNKTDSRLMISASETNYFADQGGKRQWIMQ